MLERPHVTLEMQNQRKYAGSGMQHVPLDNISVSGVPLKNDKIRDQIHEKSTASKASSYKHQMVAGAGELTIEDEENTTSNIGSSVVQRIDVLDSQLYEQ